MRRKLLTLLLLGFSLIAPVAAHAVEILTLGIDAYRPKATIEARYQALADYLSAQLKNTRVKLLVLGHAEMENAIRHNQLDLVLTNPSHYLVLRSQNSLTGVLATQVTLYNGQPTTGLGSVIFVSAQRNNLTKLSDLRDQRIAVTDREFLGGFQAGAFELLQIGIQLPGDATIMEMEHQDAIVEAVLSGRSDAGIVRTGEIEQLVAEGKIDPKQIRILNRQILPGFPFAASSRLYPEWPFVAMPHVNEQQVRKIAAALLAMESDHPAARAAGIAGFAPAADYLPVEQLARALRSPPFDTLPEFGWRDVWQRYALWIAGSAVLLGLLVAAAVWLVFLNQRVRGSMEKLRISERLLNQSQEIAHLGSWELDLIGNHLSWTDEVYRIFGLSPQQFPATYDAFLHAVHPDDRTLVNDAYTSSIRNGQDTYELEHRIVRHSTGEIRFVHEKCQHFRDASGKIISSIGMVHDITEQKLAAEDRKRHEAQFRALIDASPVPNALNDEHQNITYLNPAFIRTFGYDQSDIPTLADWWPKAYPNTEYRHWVTSTWLQRLATTKQEGKPFEPLEVDIRCKDSTIRTVLASVTALRHTFSGSHLVILYDITDRKRAESERERLHAQLLQSQKMESIGQLTGGIAHDFNNMLGAILGYAELIEHVNAGTAPSRDRIEKYVSEIYSAGSRAKELISQMLIYSRLSPETESSEAPVTLLQPLVKEVVQLLRSSIPRTIDVNYQIEQPDLRTRIQPVHFHQILLNLAINSRDAIGEYGHIDLRLTQSFERGTCSACHGSFDGEYISLTVSDTGKGIPEPILNRIFDPFFTTKDVYKGTGMGLSVVHGIVHSVGGHITVASEIGRGTAIRILLPAMTEEPTTTKAAVKTKPGRRTLSGKRIMVVDDESTIAAMLSDFLSIHDGEVTVFNLAVAALAAFKQNPNGVDLVITDETMPGLSGLDMAKAMLAVRPNLPVILCTGYSDHVDANIARQTGITAFLHKPIELAPLLQLIEASLPH